MDTSLPAKTCSECKIPQLLSEFSYRSDKPHLLRSQCKQCLRDRANRNNAESKEQRRLIQEAKREPARQYVYEYFQTHPCVDCGESNWMVLEFDHVHGDKLMNVSKMMAHSLDLIIAEIAKCESVCANCHKIRTYARAGSWRMRYV